MTRTTTAAATVTRDNCGSRRRGCPRRQCRASTCCSLSTGTACRAKGTRLFSDRRPEAGVSTSDNERKVQMSKYLIGTGLVIAAVALAVSAAVASDDDRRGPNHFRARLSGYEE